MRTKKTNKSNRSNRTYRSERTGLIPPHGGYRKLKSYQTAEVIYDGTVEFCQRWVDRTKRSYRSRTSEQMVQAARSGKQNIAEASQTSGTSKKTELKLLGVARASLEELLQDFLDFLRQRGLSVWGKEHPKTKEIRRLAYRTNRSYRTYRSYLEKDPEVAANTMICLIHQANFLLDRQIKALEKGFLEEGGFTERLYRKRTEYRGKT